MISRMRRSRAVWNASASYFAFASTAAWSLVSIPLAVRYLDREEIGLWAVVNAVLSYVVWMDLGIATATGRKMADAVAVGNRPEINRWWTATRTVLYIQGLILIVLGLILARPFLKFANVPEALQGDALFLFLGGIIIAGLSLPMRGVPGLMTAQNRFHWVPLVQGLAPWINLVAFYLLLRNGWGLRAYVIAMAVSQLATRGGFSVLLLTGPHPPRWDRSGITKERFKSLFSFSGNVAVVGLVDAFLRTLPALILARVGGLGMVPVYNFSSKGPLLGASLVGRSYQSFYPGMLRLHVKGERVQLQDKFDQVGALTIGVGLLGGAFVLLFNKAVVDLLAAPEYFAGSWANIWFAVGMITIPVSGLFRMLLPMSGAMGKAGVLAVLKLMIGSGFAVIAWNAFGMAGLAAVFAFLPVVNGIYGYFRGAKGCGFRSRDFGLRVALCAILSSVVTIGAGVAIGLVAETGSEILVSDKVIRLPDLASAVVAACLVVLGGAFTLWGLVTMQGRGSRRAAAGN